MDEKRTLEEVCAIYSFEPGLKDIFVEGETDQSFIEWYLSAKGFDFVTVYPINVIDVPDNVLQKHGLGLGSKRSCVLAVACELAEQLPQGLTVLCLADRDFEDYQPSIQENSYLSFTDCNSLELYAFTLGTMQKFITVALGGLPLSAATLIDHLIAILSRVYTLRLANELLGWKMKWIPFTRYVVVKRDSITFKDNAFILAYLLKNNRGADRGVFESKIKQAEGLLDTEAGRRIRGHDFSDLFLYIIRKMKSDRKYGNLETLEGSLMASVEQCDLESKPFFQRIHALAMA